MVNNFSYDIVLDFDGTVVKHRYPAIGEDVGAVPVLERLVKNGHRLLLNTMRSCNSEGVDTLQPALDWFISHDLPLYGINENPDQKEWTSSPKVFGNIYIDDAGLGIPLKSDDSDGALYVDWSLVSIHLYLMGLLTTQDMTELSEEGIVKDEHLEFLHEKGK